MWKYQRLPKKHLIALNPQKEKQKNHLIAKVDRVKGNRRRP
jgi:hypothetical protein